MRTSFSSFKICGTIHWPWYFLQHSSMQSTVQSTVLPGKITFEEWFLSLDKENKNLWKTFPYLNGYFEVPFLLDKALWKESHNRLDSHSCDTLLGYSTSDQNVQNKLGQNCWWRWYGKVCFGVSLDNGMRKRISTACVKFFIYESQRFFLDASTRRIYPRSPPITQIFWHYL